MNKPKYETLGEARVRAAFNPSEDGTVDQIKQKSTELINLISQIPDGTAVTNRTLLIFLKENGTVLTSLSTSYAAT